MSGVVEDGLTPYEKIRDGILAGEFASGQPLTENLLAKWCGVSRTPIREALGRLERDGLVAWTERGTVVRERTPEEILDIYATRVVLEALAARTAAERRSDHDVMMMRSLLEQAAAVDDGAESEKLHASRVFHASVHKAAHNASISELLDRVHLQLARTANTQPTLGLPGRWEQSMEFYTQLVDAISERRAEDAHSLSLDYFTKARDLRMRALAGLI